METQIHALVTILRKGSHSVPTGGDSDTFSLICKQYLIFKNKLQHILILYWILSISV